MSDAENDRGHDEAAENAVTNSNDGRDGESDAIPYSSAVHINSPLDRSLRNDTATLAATYDPEGVASDDAGKIKDALAAAAQITDENERLPHKTQFSSGDHAKRIAQIRKKRIPRSSVAKELSRMPQNKSDAETGLEVGKHTWRGLVAGVMSARKDAEAVRDAKLAEQLEEARQAQKELDRRDKEDADSQDKAKQTVEKKADARKQDGSSGPDDGGSGPAPTSNGSQSAAEKAAGTAASDQSPKAASSPRTTLVETAKEIAKTVGDAAVPIAKVAAPIALGIPPEAAVKAASGAIEAVSSSRQNSELQSTPPARSLASTTRTGPLFEQARSFPKVAEPVRAIGPENPAPRVRAQGMGLGFASLIKAARALQPREQSDLSAAAWMQKRRDSDGISR
jgi:hypothetical protein